MDINIEMDIKLVKGTDALKDAIYQLSESNDFYADDVYSTLFNNPSPKLLAKLPRILHPLLIESLHEMTKLNSPYKFVVIFAGDKLVGFCLWWINGTIEYLLVDKDYRCKGIGTKLIDFVTVWTKLKIGIGPSVCFESSNKHLCTYYSKLGFKHFINKPSSLKSLVIWTRWDLLPVEPTESMV